MCEALPELESQGVIEILNNVVATGEAFASRKMRLFLQNAKGQIQEFFLDIVCQPIVDEKSEISGLFVEGCDVTAHVRSEERQSLLIRELHHRVRNTLATVQGVMNTTARSSATIEDFQEAFAGPHQFARQDPCGDDGGTRSIRLVRTFANPGTGPLRRRPQRADQPAWPGRRSAVADRRSAWHGGS